jgi:late competence protein required for DNA uptake (superfamily II DNA/RNA helicase)
VCTQLGFNIYEATWVKLGSEHRYEHVETIREVKVTVLLNQQVRTDITVPNNKLDVIIRDHEKGTCNRCCNLMRQKCD